MLDALQRPDSRTDLKRSLQTPAETPDATAHETKQTEAPLVASGSTVARSSARSCRAG